MLDDFKNTQNYEVLQPKSHKQDSKMSNKIAIKLKNLLPEHSQLKNQVAIKIYTNNK